MSAGTAAPAGPVPAAPARHGFRTRVRGGWAGFAVRRAGGLLMSLLLLVVGTFLIVPLLPGDPARAIAGTSSSPATLAAIRDRLELNEPMATRFVHYLGDIATGRLGTSFRFDTPVADIIATRLPYTVQLVIPAVLLSLVIAVPMGMTVGVLTRGGRRRWLDVAFGTVAGLLASAPVYVVATLLVVVFSINLGLLPSGGATTISSLILPIAALCIGPAFAIARVVRQETASVLAQDYLRTARGHRLGPVRLYLRHALPNLMTSVLTLSGLVLTSLLGGTLIIENVFTYPGLGTEVVQAIIYKDYPVIQGIILVVGMLALLVNLLVDVVLGIVDPRTLEGGHRGH
ncbi:ABC transporter permease [Streptomyces sp. Li-HN-5-11]|uniref:ABC transporter permease n=1 Tax=Streptomyces sp. Li-HN-5-11 TaxID=3075432 RepID=UPI0028AD0CEB|nr:ABC transporter permease [Streptomyces sp. Li-HN-5-11]WNM33638.1 ABC transporter permease [Streptomyces sp. Li-HN-5-11]